MKLDHVWNLKMRSTPDPATRAFFDFLDSGPERATFLLPAETLTQSAIRETRVFRTAERKNSQTDYLANIGGLFQLEARLKWLRMVRKKLVREVR